MSILYSKTKSLESFSNIILYFKNIFELFRKPKSYILLGVKAFYGSARENVILWF